MSFDAQRDIAKTLAFGIGIVGQRIVDVVSLKTLLECKVYVVCSEECVSTCVLGDRIHSILRLLLGGRYITSHATVKAGSNAPNEGPRREASISTGASSPLEFIEKTTRPERTARLIACWISMLSTLPRESSIVNP